MQNLLVIIFPLVIDAFNSVGGVASPKAKFWVAILTSLLGGMLLNFSAIQAVIEHPTMANVGDAITLLGLVVASTQGFYLKYWENHSVRAVVFPTAVGAINTPATPSVETTFVPSEPATPAEPQSEIAQ